MRGRIAFVITGSLEGMDLTVDEAATAALRSELVEQREGAT